MTDSRQTANEPDGAPRIVALDILRGLAILGILFMNINDMGASLLASAADVRHLGWTRADRIAWRLREVLADGTARGLLQLLFGAGMVILTNRAAQTADEWRVLSRYYRRQLVLLGLGLLHLFVLLWPGDILHTYALAAMVAVLFRSLPTRKLLLLGLSFTLWQTAMGAHDLYARAARDGAIATAQARAKAGEPMTLGERRALVDAAAAAKGREDGKARLQREIVEEDAARRGNAASWAEAAWRATFSIAGKGLELEFVWEAAAAMLIGAALYRWGIIQGARSGRFYLGMMLIGYGVGLPLRLVAAAQVARFDGGADIGWATYELARLSATAGHLALVHLALRTVAGRRLLRPFAAAGRTALSIYILQTLICQWLIYPPFGLALYGRQDWASLMLTAAAIDAALLFLAVWWISRFAIAPVEWAWRSLAEGRKLAFVRAP